MAPGRKNDESVKSGLMMKAAGGALALTLVAVFATGRRHRVDAE